MTDLAGDDAVDRDARTRALHDLVARSTNLPKCDVSEQAAVELIGRLEEVGVGVLLFKGPVLAELLYRRGEHRGYFDIDVLVAPGDLSRARETLSGLGYENRSAQEGVDNFHGAVHAETWVRRREAAIDLHWSMAGCTVSPETAWTVLYAGRSTIELRGRTASIPGRDAIALLLALHVANHGCDGVKALGDLVRGLERWSFEDWRAAARLAEALGAVPTLAAGLRLAPGGPEMARELGLPPTPRVTWTIMQRDLRPRGTFHLASFQGATGWRSRVEVVRRSLLPPPAWLIRQFPWARRSRLTMAIGYAMHMLRAPLWTARAMRFDRLARRQDSKHGRDGGP